VEKRRAAALLRTIASVFLTLLGLLLATFLIARVVPIDPVLAVVGDRASAETYARARSELGLDQPLYSQFYRYLLLVLHGDFGRSVLTRNPVVDDIARFLPATIELATLATLIGVVLGIPAGVIAAARQGRWQDHVIRILGLLG
jgi:peptide/nickel transport system permease protein